jgi:hypothetical protein
MARVRDDRDAQRLSGLHDELDRFRRQIDAARNAFDRRKTPDRRAHNRATPDRRIVAAER